MDSESVVAMGAAIFSRANEFMTEHNRVRLLDINGEARNGNALAQTSAKISEVLASDGFLGAVEGMARDTAKAAIERKTGLQIKGEINEESLARAVGDRGGVTLTSLSDRGAIERDLFRAGAEKIGERMGWDMSGVENADGLKSAIEEKALGLLSDKVDMFAVSDVADIGAALNRYIANVIEQKIGVRLSDITDAALTKKQLLNFADAECRRRMGLGSSATVGGLKMTKKAIKNRISQRKFYARWGNRKRYVKSGITGGGDTGAGAGGDVGGGGGDSGGDGGVMIP